MQQSRIKVHLAHCYQGEYQASCKYGDIDCPAKSNPLTKALRDIEKLKLGKVVGKRGAEMQQNHSPINFTIAKGVYADQIYLKDALGKIVCDFANRENGKANSAFILLACNSYYEDKRAIKELLQGCKDATYWLDFYDADLPHNKSLAVLKNILTIAISKVGKGE